MKISDELACHLHGRARPGQQRAVTILTFGANNVDAMEDAGGTVDLGCGEDRPHVARPTFRAKVPAPCAIGRRLAAVLADAGESASRSLRLAFTLGNLRTGGCHCAATLPPISGYPESF
jgi:hypothetical protein